MNADLELLKVEIKLAEEEIYHTKGEEFIDGYDTCKELVDKYLQARKSSWETIERNRVLRELGFNGGD